MELCQNSIVHAPSKKWNLRALLFWHGVIGFLLLTFFCPLTRPAWDAVDSWFFLLFNGTLEGNPRWQVFWALANHSFADWVEDIVIFVFFILSVRSAPRPLRVARIAQLLFGTLYISLILYFVGRLLFREYLHLMRDSPTLVLNGGVLLSQELDWLKVKDMSTKSFPADHATTALLFGTIYSFFSSKKLMLCGVFYSVFLCLPRLMVGAHWLSDILVGSGSIIIFFISWAFCSPLQSWASEQLERGLKKIPVCLKS